MKTLARGENDVLAAPRLTAEVTGVTPGSVDLMVFQVTTAGRVRTDDDLTFFNQPRSPEGAVQLTGPGSVAIDVTKVPNNIHTLRLAVSLDDSVAGSLATISGLGVTCGAVSLPAIGLTTERAAVLAEIYRRGDRWKLRNVSAGWDGGLPALVREHGVSVDDDRGATAASPPTATAAAPKPAPAPPAPPVRLSKITLTKTSPTISLAKDQTHGTMRVNLNWTKRRGFLGVGAVDLDLSCLYQLNDGSKGVIQPLGKMFGNFHHPPYISLDGDDRSGVKSGGENLHINLAHLEDFKRILIFAYIYEGTPNWAAANGIVTLYPAAGPEVEIPLDSPDNRARSCAVALLKNKKGDLVIDREVRYIRGHQREVSAAYRWGLKWTAGRK